MESTQAMYSLSTVSHPSSARKTHIAERRTIFFVDGFVPDSNNSDALFLDDIVLRDIDTEQRLYLKEDNYLG